MDFGLTDQGVQNFVTIVFLLAIIGGLVVVGTISAFDWVVKKIRGTK